MEMNPRYRKHIEDNVDRLIALTNYEDLIEECVHCALITPNMRDIIEDIDPDLGDSSPKEWLRKERHKRLFLKITRRGEEAYNHLKLVLGKLGSDAAIQVLNEPRDLDDTYTSIRNNRSIDPENNISVPAISSDGIVCSHCKKKPKEMPNLEEYPGEINPSKKVLVKKSDKIHTNESLGQYSMKSQHNRGIFFCVNIIDFPKKDDRRNGSDLDVHALLDLHKQMNFKVFAYGNLSKDEFIHLLKQLVKSSILGNIECFKMALMTHGNMYGGVEYVQFNDGSLMCVNDILEYFTHANCPGLQFKPKIFIFPFCRGEEVDHGYYPHLQHDGIGNMDGNRSPPLNIHTMQDILVCYATIPGYRTHRDPDEGSWYVQNYCKIIAEHAHHMDFEDMVKKINHDTGNFRTEKNTLQMGSYTNVGFNKKLYLNPGIWEESH